jgi:hypothetical protein
VDTTPSARPTSIATISEPPPIAAAVAIDASPTMTTATIDVRRDDPDELDMAI